MTEHVDVDRLAAEVERWRLEGGSIDRDLSPTDSRNLRRALSGERLPDPGLIDRLTTAMGKPMLYTEIVALERQGRKGYIWAEPHPCRKLTPEQVKAANVLHIDGGLSIRELGRRLWRQLGYSSEKSCAMALSDAFRRDGLPRRDRIEAVRLVNDARGYVRGRDRNSRQRQRRAERRASDPAFRQAELERLERLHSRQASDSG